MICLCASVDMWHTVFRICLLCPELNTMDVYHRGFMLYHPDHNATVRIWLVAKYLEFETKYDQIHRKFRKLFQRIVKAKLLLYLYLVELCCLDFFARIMFNG